MDPQLLELKTVRGNLISESINQMNVIVVKEGPKPVAETLGIEEKPKEEEKKGE